MGKPFLFYLKEHKVLHQWFFKLIQIILKACNDIHGVNIFQMYWMLLAPALLQDSHKKLTANHDVLATSHVYDPKDSSVKLSSFHLFGKTFRYPPLKFINAAK